MCIITNVRAMDSTKASDLNEINKRKEEKYIYIYREKALVKKRFRFCSTTKKKKEERKEIKSRVGLMQN